MEGDLDPKAHHTLVDDQGPTQASHLLSAHLRPLSLSHRVPWCFHFHCWDFPKGEASQVSESYLFHLSMASGQTLPELWLPTGNGRLGPS